MIQGEHKIVREMVAFTYHNEMHLFSLSQLQGGQRLLW